MEPTVSVDQEIAIILNQPPNTVHLVWRKAVVEGNGDWTQPKFHFEIAVRDMNVRRLIRLAAIEVETIRPDSEDGGHYRIVSLLFIASKAKRPLFQHGRRSREETVSSVETVSSCSRVLRLFVSWLIRLPVVKSL
jgi:hypothetical protein